MPYYYSRSVEVGLSVADLDQTTTVEPSRTLGPESTANAEHASAIFRDNYTNGRLRETGICAEDGRELQFLGEFSDMPFIMVHARPNSAAINPPNGGHPTRAHPSQGAMALSLTVRIPSKSLLPLHHSEIGLSGKPDVKIDVFLNGQLCASTSIQEREGYSDQHGVLKLFSGARVGRLIERPWILNLSNLDLQNRFSQNDEITAPEIHEKWNTVSEALESFVESFGISDHGKIPITCEYLKCLARAPVPSGLSSLNVTGEQAFAFIDVVITTGKSRNKRSHDLYLMSPRPLRLPGFGKRNKNASRVLSEIQPKLQAEIGDRRRSADVEVASQPFSLHHQPRGESEGKPIQTLTPKEPQVKSKEATKPSTELRRTSPSRLRVRRYQSSSSSSSLMQNKPDQSLSHDAYLGDDQAIQTTSRKHTEDFSAPAHQGEGPPPKKQKPRFHYHIVLSTEQTREEEIESLEAQAREDAYLLGCQTRSTRSCVANAARFHADLERLPAKIEEPAGEIVTIEDKNASPTKPNFKKPQRRPVPIFPSYPALQSQGDKPREIYSESLITPKQPTALPPPVKRSGFYKPRPRMTKASSRPPSTPSSISDQLSSSPEKPLILRHASTSSHSTVSNIHVDRPQDTAKPSPNLLQQPSRLAVTSSVNASTRAPEPWEVSELCKNSVVTYAPEGVLRQVKGEKYVPFLTQFPFNCSYL